MFIGCNEGPAAAGIQLAGSDALFYNEGTKDIDLALPVAKFWRSRSWSGMQRCIMHRRARACVGVVATTNYRKLQHNSIALTVLLGL